MSTAGEPAGARRRIPRAVRAHAFLIAAAAAVLIGGGIRYVPIGSAATGPGAGSGSTACAAT